MVQREDCAGGRKAARICSVLTSDCTGRVASGAAVTFGRYTREVGVWICDSVAGAARPDENWQHGAGDAEPLIAIEVCGIEFGGQHE